MGNLHIYKSSSHLPRGYHGFCDGATLMPSQSRSSPRFATPTSVTALESAFPPQQIDSHDFCRGIARLG